ncbi:hypothetical protein PG996_001149 [Apiospora saccharicola]|uniref:Uncharacterized protein n=1 Tax=Apiospora saccharicola TaxID=335842 RepID=A0ABR1WK09_9PEZI
MSLRKISPGVYISIIPQSLEASFESLCDDYFGLSNQSSTRQVDGCALAREESPTGSDGYHPNLSTGSCSPWTYNRSQCKGPCLTYTFPGPPRHGPPPARPDPGIPKGHVVVMMPKVPPKGIHSPGSCPRDSKGHVFIVMPEEQEQKEGPDNSPPATDASEPFRSPRSTSPQPSSSSGKDRLEAGSGPSPPNPQPWPNQPRPRPGLPSKHEHPCSSETAWVAVSSAPDAELKDGEAAEQTSAVECVVCGDRFKMSG